MGIEESAEWKKERESGETWLRARELGREEEAVRTGV